MTQVQESTTARTGAQSSHTRARQAILINPISSADCVNAFLARIGYPQ